MKNLENTIIILESSSIVTKTLRNGLLKRGIVFPDKYQLIDSITKPFGTGKLFVYSPVCLLKK